MDKSIVDLRARIEEASGEEREALRRQLQNQVSLRESMGETSAHLDTELTPQLRELVKKWEPKFDALEEKYEK